MPNKLGFWRFTEGDEFASDGVASIEKQGLIYIADFHCAKETNEVTGKTRYEFAEGYGVDEFMYFIEGGGVTMTSQDGTVQIVRAGEAVTVPKE